MRAIWSRATSNPGTCRCISCVSNTGALARRSGQTALRRTRAIGTPTSTFVYTTIFAAGLAIDARAKAARNTQWEKAFSSLAESAGDGSPGERTKDTDTATDSVTLGHGYHGLTFDDLPDDFDWSALERIVGMELDEDPVLENQEIQSQIRDYAELEDLRFDSRFPGMQLLEFPTNTGPELIRYNLPPQSLWAPDALRVNALQRRHSWKKLAMQELSTGLLIHELLHKNNVPRFDKAWEVDSDNLSQQIQDVIAMNAVEREQARQNILEALENLHQIPVDSPPDVIAQARIHPDHPGIPEYYQDVDGDFYAITIQMNQSIQKLFESDVHGNDRKEAVVLAKICHNLLVSSASPDLQTFNTLLVGFRQWRRRNLIDCVIPALNYNKIRPNEITCREILNHYASLRHGNPEDFSRFVARMRGVGDGLMLATPKVNVNEASHGRLVRVDEKKVYQKVHPTPMVFSSLITGVMRFAGFDRALDIYYEMKADGWGLDVQGLTRMLNDCLRRADWEGGLYIWGEISSIKARVNHEDMTKAYGQMIGLCSITGNTVAFNQILADISTEGFDREKILGLASRNEHVAKKKKLQLAPAWVADNVMIAASAYIKDTRDADVKDALEGIDGDDNTTFIQGEPDDSDAHDAAGSTEDIADNTADPKEVWASWLEREFGERPKDPEP
ncbi:hypothetical protein J4E85_010913 [Alternaria conjuncta]|uniref:uncharacterized protein n=1 Tax=Alternaria conjuncta TaxID=181017 RepID=UPI00221FE24E|nr:uncharacterized protein J4E85_010913 [Alternaria conjuncta]KAI4913180.1 hypothetical protein J4E85_010913 [Alternaria conjuncta]